MPQGQLVAPKSDEGGRGAWRGARCLAMTEIKLRRIPHSALPHSALERLFSGIHFGMDDGQYGLPKNNFAG